MPTQPRVFMSLRCLARLQAQSSLSASNLSHTPACLVLKAATFPLEYHKSAEYFISYQNVFLNVTPAAGRIMWVCLKRVVFRCQGETEQEVRVTGTTVQSRKKAVKLALSFTL